VRLGWAAAGGLLLAACGSGGSPPAALHTAAPATYLLSLDELRTPGFTVAEGPHDTAGDCAAATVRYFREVPELALSNGPLDVRSTVLRCGSIAQATAAYAAAVKRTDAVGGETPESAGVLGDAAHADTLRVSSAGVGLVEVTLSWRSANLVSTLVIRERDAGNPLADALILAHAEAAGLPAR